MKHCFEIIDVDKEKFLFNGKTADLANFYYWKKEKLLLLVMNQKFTNLSTKPITAQSILFVVIFCIYYII